MDIILKQDIKGLGYKYDVVKVKNGYGRNYLIPEGLAAVANKSTLKERDENVKQATFKQEKLKNDATALANGLNELTLSLGAKVGEKGRIFGAITTLQVADALKAKGFDVDRRRIEIKADIKEVGTYTVEVDLHREVKAEFKIEVVAE
ncbi:MAG: 50S ribosomal protein L9 [Sphingobacteriaceae bacterium]|jgi:large subunit ribosomal protein L9|nr:50S ribosomal protein L9 [Sphingobacteriaceae bacterium]